MKTAFHEAIERFNLTAICSIESLDEIFAKEKQQMIDFYVRGCNDTYGVDEPNPRVPDSIEAANIYKDIFK